jgi:heat shock protein HtpX
VCPACATALVRVGDAAPWCPACQWGLALFEPGYHPGGVGVRVVDRWLYRRAYRRTLAHFAAAAGRPAARPGWGPARAAAAGIALLVHAASVACLVAGVWLGAQNFPGLPLVPAVLLVAAGAGLWPRPPRLDRNLTRLDRGQAPALHALVDRVAAAVGAPAPQVICLSDGFAADAGRHGWRLRRHLVLGVPLLAVLPAQQRVALLGHQLGHFVDRDPARDRLIGPVDGTLAGVAAALTPGADRTLRAVQDPRVLAAAAGTRGVAVSPTQGLVWLIELIGRPVTLVLRVPVLLLRVLLAVLMRADTHRAEYFADALAARAGGSAAAAGALDVQLFAEPVLTRLGSHVRAGGTVPDWPAVAAQVLARGEPQRAQRRQLSVRRQVSAFPGHPPLGLRAQLVESRPPQDAAVTLEPADSLRLDAELRHHYDRTARDLRTA